MYSSENFVPQFDTGKERFFLCNPLASVQDLFANAIIVCNTPRCFVPQHDKKNNTFKRFYCLISPPNSPYSLHVYG